MLITLAQTQSHDSISNSSNVTRRGKAKRFLEFHNFSVSLLFASELSWATCAREEHFTEFLPGLGTCVPRSEVINTAGGDTNPGQEIAANYQHSSHVSCSVIIITTKRGAKNICSYLQPQS